MFVLKGKLKGAMVGAPLIFVDSETGKEFRTLAVIKSIEEHGDKVNVVTVDGCEWEVDK